MTSEKEPKQDKEALRERWAWVEHGVWTDSMLRTLERGIKGGKWFALIDKRKGRARGRDHYRWRNRFFDEAGLFNLTAVRLEGR